MKVKKTFRNIAQYVPQILVLFSVLTSNVFFPAIAIAEELPQLKQERTQSNIPVDDSEDILDEGISTNIYEEEEVVEEEAVEPLFVYEDGVYTLFSVVEGEEYVYPGNDDVRITFSRVTEDGDLVIKRVLLTEDEKSSLNTSDDYGWDITSSMSNGSFTYDLTLPNTQGDDVEVKYTEDGSNYESVDRVSVESMVVRLEGLEHFTTFIVVETLPSGISNGDSCTVASINGICYDTIQAAIDAAEANGDTVQDIINIQNGTYTENLSINGNNITLLGESRTGVIIDTSSPSSYGISASNVDNVTLRKMTVIGAQNYTLKISHSSNVTLRQITVKDSKKTGIDLNTIDGAKLNSVTVNDTTNGFGLMILDSNDVVVNTINTSGNAWGGVSVQTASRPSDNITFTGNFNVDEFNAFLLEKDGPTLYDITNITLPSSLNYVTFGHDTGKDYYKSYYYENLDDAKTFASVIASGSYDDVIIHDLDKDNYWVIPGLSIQDAIDDATGTTIHVAAGTYEEQVVIEKSIELISEGNATILTPDTLSFTPVDGSGKTYQSSIFINSDLDEIDVTIDGFVINADNFSPTGRYSGILIENANAHIKNNEITNILVNGKETFGILVYGNEIVIEENNIPNFARGGIGIYSGSATIKNNTVTGPGPNELVTWAPNGIQIGYGASGTIEGNEVSGCGWPGTEWSGTGIMVVDTSDVNIVANTVKENEQGIAVVDYPAALYGPAWEGVVSDIKVLDNIVRKNSWGLSISNDASNIHVEGNHFSETEYDNIDVYTYAEGVTPPSNVVIYKNKIESAGSDQLWVGDRVTETVDAEENWWGSDKFEEVSVGVVGNADYCPWLDAPDGDPVGPCLGDIQGRTFIDKEWNGLLLQDDGDYPSGMADDFTVRLYDGNWVLIDEQTTNTTGNIGQYKFSNLDNEGSTYRVCGVEKNEFYYSPADISQSVLDVFGNPIPTSEYAEIVSNSSGEIDESPVCWELTLNSQLDGTHLGIGYTNETPNSPDQLGYMDRDDNVYSCNNDFTNMNGIKVLWEDVSTGDTPPDDMLLYQRQYSRDGTNWHGNEIYSDTYTNYRSFGYGEIIHYSRVRAFFDMNMNGQFDSWEPMSKWSNPCSITYDVTNPLVDITSHEDGDWVRKNIDIKGTASDLNLWRYWFVIEDNVFGNRVAGLNTVYPTSSPVFINYPWDTKSVPDGQYMAKLEARDKADNKDPNMSPVPMDPEVDGDSVDWVVLNVDNTRPEAEITDPTVMTYTNDTITFSGSAKDTNLRRIWLLLGDEDGKPIKEGGKKVICSELKDTDLTNPDWNDITCTDFDVTSYVDGTYSMIIEAWDMSWNYRKDHILFELDRTAPESIEGVNVFKGHNSDTENLLSCPTGYTNDTKIRIEWEPSDDPDIDYYWFGTQFNNHHRKVYAPDTHYDANMTPGHNPYYYTVIAVDKAGNESAISKLSVSCEVMLDQLDPTAPELEGFLNPDLTCGSTTNVEDKMITIDWSDSDGTGTDIKGYQYQISYPTTIGGRSVWTTHFTGTTSQYRGSLNEGTHYIRVKAEDMAGNWSDWSKEWVNPNDLTSEEMESTCSITYDSTPPIIAWNTPSDTELLSRDISLEVTCDGTTGDCDYINFWWWRDDQTIQNAIDNKQYHYEHTDGTSFTWTLDSLNPEQWDGSEGETLNGVYTLRAAGNRTVEDITVTIDNESPVIAGHSNMILTEGDAFPTNTVELTDNYELDEVCTIAEDLTGTLGISPEICVPVDSSNLTGDQFALADEIREGIEDWQGGNPFTTIDLKVLPEGQYEITYHATDKAGNISDTQSFTVTINDNIPTVEITADDTEITQGDADIVLGTNITNGNSPFTYLWGTDCTGTATTTIFLGTNEPDSYTCTVTITDADGDTATDSIDITVGAVAGATDEDTNNNVVQRTLAVVNGILGTGTGSDITNEEEETTPKEKEVLGEEVQTCEDPRTVSGYIYNDKNKDDEMGEKEEGIAGVSIKVYTTYQDNLITISKLETDENGYWETELCPGEYSIEIDQETVPNNLETPEVLSLTVEEDDESIELNISATDPRNFWQRYWYIILILGALLFTTTYLIISGSRKEQQYTQ